MGTLIQIIINTIMGAFNTSTQQSDQMNNSFYQQWQVISDSKSTKYVNKISQDEFILKMIDSSAKDMNSYKLRQFYTFQNNPRVVLIAQNQKFAQILVQDTTKTLKSWISQRNLSQSEVLFILRSVIEGFEKLQQRHGPFYITEKMVRINKMGRILLWINEKFQSNHIDYKLPEQDGEQTMLVQILKLFSNRIEGFEFEFYPTFKKAISYINKIFLSNSLRETQCTEWKKTNKMTIYHHSRKLTDQFKNNQTMNSYPKTAQALRITDQSRMSSQYGSKKSDRNPQQIKKHKRIYSTTPKNCGPFLTEFNKSELVESFDQSSQKEYSNNNKRQNSNLIPKIKKYPQRQFQINMNSTLQDHMKKNEKIPIMQTINEVSKSNISNQLDSPSIGLLRLKKSDSAEEISSPEIRKIRAQLNNLL